MQIGRIQEIKDFGIFSDWTSSVGGHEHQFGRQTLVFGHNGAGKTTLARLLGEIGRHRATGATDTDLTGVRLQLVEGANDYAVRGEDARIPKILVFNQDYIAANLGQAFSAGNHATALYVLGAENLELETEIVGLEAKISATKLERDRVGDEQGVAENHEKQLIDEVKKKVVEHLGGYDGQRFNQTTYNTTKARTLVKDGGTALDAASKQNAIQVLASHSEDLPGPILLPTRPLLAEAARSTAAAIDLSVTAIVIESLGQDQEVESWVQRGIPMHEHREVCAFCDAPLSDERRKVLDHHFNDSYRRSTELILRVRKAIASTTDALTEFENYCTERGREQGGVTDFIEQRAEDLGHWVEEQRKCLAQLTVAVDARDADRFSTLDLTIPDPPPDKVFDELADAVRAENEARQLRRDNLQQDKTKAEKSLLSHIASERQDDYTSRSVKARSFKVEAEKIDELIEEVEGQLKAATARRSSTDDGEELAGDLTKDLADYLGRRELTVEHRVIDETGGFQFLRSGHLATGLSEGEQTAIALLYFLCSLRSREHEDELAQTIVVIDDPVSSLDQNALLSALAFMQARLGNCGGLKCGQLIVLTHNFTFYRLYKQRMQNALRKDRTAADEARTNGEAPTSPVAALLDVRAERIGTSRVPTLRNPGPKLEKSTSEYATLFESASHATRPEGEASVPVAGNAARRVLETFVSFKQPMDADLRGAAERLGKAHGLPPEVTTRVVAALHDSSHRQEPDIHAERHISDLVQDIRCMLQFIRDVDEEHYKGMVALTGCEPDLAEEPATSTEATPED